MSSGEYGDGRSRARNQSMRRRSAQSFQQTAPSGASGIGYLGSYGPHEPNPRIWPARNFAIRPDGTGPRQLSLLEGRVIEIDGTFAWELPVHQGEVGDALNFFFEADDGFWAYDHAGVLVRDMQVLGSDDLCGTKPCWKETGNPLAPSGVIFKDNGLQHDGIQKIVFRAGAPGGSRSS